jgi:hypothetical protein
VPPLISFDIDGTLEVGDPPGLISVDMVRECKRLGYLIGSCTVLKHRLADVKSQLHAEAYFHIGDTDLDHFFAGEAGFRFFRADAAMLEAWGPALFITPP